MNTAAKLVIVFKLQTGAIRYIDARKDDRYFISSSNFGCIKLWDVRQTHVGRIKEMSPYPSSLVQSNWCNNCSVLTCKFGHINNPFLRGKFSPKEQTGQRYIYAACDLEEIIIYDILTCQIKEQFKSHMHPVTDAEWKPVHTEIVSVALDKCINLNCHQNTSNDLPPNQSIPIIYDDNDSTDEDNLMPTAIYR